MQGGPRLMDSGTFGSWDDGEYERYSSEEDQPTQTMGCDGCHFRQSCRHRRAALGRPVCLILLVPPLVDRVGMVVMCFGGALRHSKGGGTQRTRGHRPQRPAELPAGGSRGPVRRRHVQCPVVAQPTGQADRGRPTGRSGRDRTRVPRARREAPARAHRGVRGTR